MMRSFLARMFIVAAAFLAESAVRAEVEKRLLFFGDVMLTREVEREVSLRKGLSPLSMMEGIGWADVAMINFEGVLDDPEQPGEGCRNRTDPCFAVDEAMLSFLSDAGITAAGLANNHAGDLGSAGRERTKKVLQERGIDPLDFADSPGFVRVGHWSVAIIAVNLTPGHDEHADPVPSLEAARKMRLARTLADWVVVFVHWGGELRHWPQPSQQIFTDWFIDQGADVIVGHHPHVVIPPECVRGKPVFYSLGNYVFDQKYPDSKKGLIADCRPGDDGLLRCQALETRTSMETSYPRLMGPAAVANATLAQCPVPAKDGLEVSGRRLFPWTENGILKSDSLVIEGRAEGQRPWRVAGRKVLSLEAGVLEGGLEPFVVTVEQHFSPMDKENSPRPYVYAVGERGLVARWRGTALAWPLVDARLMPDPAWDEVMLLCALHRGDSFIQLNPTTTERRTAVYRWNGFGFSGVNDDQAVAACRKMYGL